MDTTMMNFSHCKMMFDLLNEGKHDVSVGLMSNSRSVNERSILDSENQTLAVCKRKASDADNNAREGKQSDDSTHEKLRSFFESVQKQHPESRLELQYVDGKWKVWCGVCKKLLRPDKSGKAIHNIQRQHFSSSRHKKKLQLMLEQEAPKEDNPTDGKSNTAQP